MAYFSDFEDRLNQTLKKLEEKYKEEIHQVKRDAGESLVELVAKTLRDINRDRRLGPEEKDEEIFKAIQEAAPLVNSLGQEKSLESLGLVYDNIFEKKGVSYQELVNYQPPPPEPAPEPQPTPPQPEPPAKPVRYKKSPRRKSIGTIDLITQGGVLDRLMDAGHSLTDAQYIFDHYKKELGKNVRGPGKIPGYRAEKVDVFLENHKPK